jgi:hypothetical protein
LDADLRDLIERGLLHHDKRDARFDLHPIVRRYAYDRLAAADRAVAHIRLRDYFAAVPPPDKVTRLEDLATGLANVANMAQLPIGALRAAEANMCRSIALCREIKEEFKKAVAHQGLGYHLAYRGADAESETELTMALQMFEQRSHVQLQGVTLAYLAHRELPLLRHTACRGNLKFEISNFKPVHAAARRACLSRPALTSG